MSVSFLEGEPAFMDLGNRYQTRRSDSLGGGACGRDVKACVFVIASLSMRAPLPEISEEHEVLRQKILASAKYEIKSGNRFLETLGSQSPESLGHPEFQIVEQWKPSSIQILRVVDEPVEEREIPITKIGPLRHTQKKRDRVRFVEVEPASRRECFVEKSEAGMDISPHEGTFQPLYKH
jgi:hypothetical protein